jgi:hypothetical protein
MATPFSENVTDFPAAGELSDVLFKVAESIALPPYGPLAGATVSVLATAGATMVTVAVAELLAALGSTAELLLTLAVLAMEAPLMSLLLVWATMVTVSVWPFPRDEKVTVR